ncbi:hypothetical protein [Pseudoalteromonas ruthenica]|uniref:hypothetical protein n=1 Tax=Pseudoalteromonas ruthenica TaxID=151081 RepID=UPI00241DC7DD|nr:hypothetical protein [Pseudoalteromonas ruthenica]
MSKNKNESNQSPNGRPSADRDRSNGRGNISKNHNISESYTRDSPIQNNITQHFETPKRPGGESNDTKSKK